METPRERAARVERLRQQVQAGTYRTDPLRLAHAILESTPPYAKMSGRQMSREEADRRRRERWRLSARRRAEERRRAEMIQAASVKAAAVAALAAYAPAAKPPFVEIEIARASGELITYETLRLAIVAEAEAAKSTLRLDKLLVELKSQGDAYVRFIVSGVQA